MTIQTPEHPTDDNQIVHTLRTDAESVRIRADATLEFLDDDQADRVVRYDIDDFHVLANGGDIDESEPFRAAIRGRVSECLFRSSDQDDIEVRIADIDADVFRVTVGAEWYLVRLNTTDERSVAKRYTELHNS